jgi:hypothetical protein
LIIPIELTARTFKKAAVVEMLEAAKDLLNAAACQLHDV